MENLFLRWMEMCFGLYPDIVDDRDMLNTKARKSVEDDLQAVIPHGPPR